MLKSLPHSQRHSQQTTPMPKFSTPRKFVIVDGGTISESRDRQVEGRPHKRQRRAGDDDSDSDTFTGNEPATRDSDYYSGLETADCVIRVRNTLFKVSVWYQVHLFRARSSLLDVSPGRWNGLCLRARLHCRACWIMPTARRISQVMIIPCGYLLHLSMGFARCCGYCLQRTSTQNDIWLVTKPRGKAQSGYKKNSKTILILAA